MEPESFKKLSKKNYERIQRELEVQELMMVAEHPIVAEEKLDENVKKIVEEATERRE